jgi:hypothetical protein
MLLKLKRLKLKRLKLSKKLLKLFENVLNYFVLI